MKLPSRIPLLLAAALLAVTPLRAQTADDGAVVPAPAGSTVITSDELHSDQASHVSVFSGNVVVVGTNFKMSCQEMTVFFTPDNKVDRIVSTGDVVINQPDRITHCGHAEYIHDEDKFVLTEDPNILDHGNKVTGQTITIYRTSQKMVVNGGRSRVILSGENLSTPPAAGTSTTDNK